MQHSAAGPLTTVVGSHQGIDGFALTSPNDQVIAYDYAHTGKQDALLLYRPGSGLVTIVGHAAGNTFWPHLISSSGIAGYDLADTRDRIVAFDYAHTGMADHLAVYRPGTGYLDVVRHDPADTYLAIHVSHRGVGSVGWFDLRNAQDRSVPYDFGRTGSADHLLLYRPGGRAVTIGTRQDIDVVRAMVRTAAQSAILIADSSPAWTSEDVSFTPSCHDLLESLLAVCDGRSGQDRDHPVAVVLALVAAAAIAGLKGYTAISGWVADVPADILDSLYERVEARPGGRPSRSTLWRVCTDIDDDVLDAVIAEWTTAQRTGAGEQGPTSTDTRAQIRLDGKTVRGAVDADGEQLHLLSALAGSPGPDPAAVIIAQAPTDGAKTR
ncbi:transposase family protein [Micromonospora sp. NPDC047557]|uniref:transposase family protein n=1 Tax=Micromonospora sp. NPDC047557 TaxID=3364250 RepID=UPI0037216D61